MAARDAFFGAPARCAGRARGFCRGGSWASPVGSTRAWASSLAVGGYDEGWLQRRRTAAGRRKSRPARGGRAVGAEAGGAGGSVRRQEGGSLGWLGERVCPFPSSAGVLRPTWCSLDVSSAVRRWQAGATQSSRAGCCGSMQARCSWGRRASASLSVHSRATSVSRPVTRAKGTLRGATLRPARSRFSRGQGSMVASRPGRRPVRRLSMTSDRGTWRSDRSPRRLPSGQLCTGRQRSEVLVGDALGGGRGQQIDRDAVPQVG